MTAQYSVYVDWDGDEGQTVLGSFETGRDGWQPGGSVNPAIARDTTRAHHGEASLLITWGTGGFLPLVEKAHGPLVVGTSYTTRAWVYVPTGSNGVALAVDGIGFSLDGSTTFDQWQQITHTWTAIYSYHLIQLWPAFTPVGGERVWLDEPTIAIAGEDVSTPGRVMLRSPLTAQYGRDQSRALSPTAPGEAAFDLNNQSRDYSPENAASPLAGKIRPGRPVVVKATLTVATVGLVVGDAGNPTAGDLALRTQINRAGYAAAWVDDAATLPTGYQGFVIADSVTAATVGTKYRDVAKPVVTIEHDLWDDNRLATNVGASTTASATYDLDTHPITAGLPDPITFLTSAIAQRGVIIASALPAGATSFARPSADTTRAAGWAVDTGGALTTGTAAARRVALFLPEAMAVALTANGVTFLGQVFGWAFASLEASGQAEPSKAYTLFAGQLDDTDVLPNYEERSVSYTATDALGAFKGVDVSTELYRGIRTGDAIGHILDAAGWPADARDIDIGATTIRWWWEEKTDAFTALEKVVNSEGPPAFVSVSPEGKLVFRDRHHRLLRARSLTSQATFRDTGAEPVMTAPLVYGHGWKEIVNSVTVSVDERAPDIVPAAVWTSSRTYSLAENETVPIRIESSDPFIDAEVPVAGVDYQLRAGAVSFTLSGTSGVGATLFMTATLGPMVLDSLQVRAYPVAVQRTVQVHAESSTSIENYGRRSDPRDMPWANEYDAAAIADIILAQRAERLPTVTIQVVSKNDTRRYQQLARDLSDRVTIVDAETGLNGDFYIERIQHQVEEGLIHRTWFACEKVPAQPTDVFILGSATRGVIGTNRLGKRGLDDPATVFVVGSATNGVLGTNLLGR